MLRLGSPLEALEAFLDGARVARDAGRLEDAFELDRKGRDARDAVIMRRPCVCSMASATPTQAQRETESVRESSSRAVLSRRSPPGRRASRLDWRIGLVLNRRATGLFSRLAQGTCVEVYASHGLGLRVKRTCNEARSCSRKRPSVLSRCATTRVLRVPLNYKGSSPSAAVRAKKLFEERVQGASKRFRAHRRSMEAEGCVVGCGISFGRGGSII